MSLTTSPDVSPPADVAAQALILLSRLSLTEKIGQKLMLALYPPDLTIEALTRARKDSGQHHPAEINPTITQLLGSCHIGGVILFANNLLNTTQIITLTDTLQQAMHQQQRLPLLISIDEEGGHISRLPDQDKVIGPGNMAIAAAHLGHPDINYSKQFGLAMGTHLRALGFNTNFAPSVDVNTNPHNPVIHVRAFSDNPQLVATLGLAFHQGLQTARVASTLKHFPGHGGTHVDSHLDLPRVPLSLSAAWATDLYPFEHIIHHTPPDMVMVAHIQYPALDHTKVYANLAHKMITVPATLSRKIQHDVLRQQLHYQGITITDALNMGAITKYFDPCTVTIGAFQAGSDIALMPMTLSPLSDPDQLDRLINQVVAATHAGTLSLEEIDASVLRILTLKIKLGLLQPDSMAIPQKIQHAQTILHEYKTAQFATTLASHAITLVQNHHLLPIACDRELTYRLYVLMPTRRQGEIFAAELKHLQAMQRLPAHITVNYATLASIDTQQQAFQQADLVIVGTNVTCLTLKLTDHGQLAYQALQYAKRENKQTIFISLLAPYDLPHYRTVADAMFAVYHTPRDGTSHHTTTGPLLPSTLSACVQAIFGLQSVSAKLPVNVPDDSSPASTLYHRGMSLTIPGD